MPFSCPSCSVPWQGNSPLGVEQVKASARELLSGHTHMPKYGCFSHGPNLGITQICSPVGISCHVVRSPTVVAGLNLLHKPQWRPLLHPCTKLCFRV